MIFPLGHIVDIGDLNPIQCVITIREFVHVASITQFGNPDSRISEASVCNTLTCSQYTLNLMYHMKKRLLKNSMFCTLGILCSLIFF